MTTCGESGFPATFLGRFMATFSIWGITPGAVGELVLTFPAVTAVAELLAAPGAGGRSVLHRVLPPLQTSLGIEKGPT